MSNLAAEQGGRLEPEFWQRLDRLEARHRRAQALHEEARRGLERLTTAEVDELREAWRHYCEVIAELDCAAAEFEHLRSCPR